MSSPYDPELSDYKRMVEAPMIAQFREQIASWRRVAERLEAEKIQAEQQRDIAVGALRDALGFDTEELASVIFETVRREDAPALVPWPAALPRTRRKWHAVALSAARHLLRQASQALSATSSSSGGEEP